MPLFLNNPHAQRHPKVRRTGAVRPDVVPHEADSRRLLCFGPRPPGRLELPDTVADSGLPRSRFP